MDMNAYREAMAQALVKNLMDIPTAWKTVYPPDGTGSLCGKYKTPSKIKQKFAEIYGGDAQLWRRVAELQKIADQHTALETVDIVRFWENAALLDRREISQVVAVPCECGGAAGCVRCGGTGSLGSVVAVTPTASYSPAAAAVYEGAEMTKYGVKVHTVSKQHAFEMLARHKGLLNEKLLLARQDALPPDVPALPDDPNEASRAYSEFVKGV